MKPSKIDIISFTNQGLRASNDDRPYSSQIDENTYLLLLADGMGGYADGHLAAEMAIEEISSYIKKGVETDIEQRIEFAFLNAHRVIKEKLHNAGTTIGGILLTPESVYVFWAGDIKATLINGNHSFTSKEHTLLNVLKDAQITIKPEEISRLTHTVVRSVGGDSKTYLPEIVKLEKGERFKGALYSDGMFAYFSTGDVLDLLKRTDYNELKKNFDPSIFNDSKDNVTGMFFFSD